MKTLYNILFWFFLSQIAPSYHAKEAENREPEERQQLSCLPCDDNDHEQSNIHNPQSGSISTGKDF